MSKVDLVVAEKKREIEWHRVVVDGDTVVPSTVDETPAAVVLTLTPADAEAVKRGELDLSVAFMRGTMKMTGDPGVLLHVLPVLSRSTLL
jgi:SCP-2 sterol transfer family